MKRKHTVYAGLMAVLILLLGGMALPVRSASAAKVIAKGSCGEMTKESHKRGQKRYNRYYKKQYKERNPEMVEYNGGNFYLFDNVGLYASDKVRWKLYDNGTMVISGKGDMIGCDHTEYDSCYEACFYRPQPWGKYREKIKKLVVKQGVTTIGSEMFWKCTALEEIRLPKSLEKIEWYAFRECVSLRKVQWKEGIKEVRMDAFYGCSSLEHIRLPKSVMDWGGGVFAYCGLKEIDIPEVAATWGSGSFEGCDSLKEVKIPAKIKNYCSGMFKDCSSLEKVVLEEGVTFHEVVETYEDDWGGGTFYWDSGERMFENCTALTEINLPERMRIMPAGFLKGCTALTIEKLPEGIEYLGWYPDAGQGGEAKIPETVTTIGSYCFADMEGLKEITIPPNVRSIEDEAFAGSGLKKITIPETVTELEECVFANCSQLEEADIRAGVEEIKGGFFRGCSSLRTLYLPGTLKEIYLAKIFSRHYFARYHDIDQNENDNDNVNDTFSLETLVIRSPHVETLSMGSMPISTTIYAPAAKIKDYKKEYREHYNKCLKYNKETKRQKCTWKELESLKLPEEKEAGTS